MGKTSGSVGQSSKSTIAKDKLCDRDFDELVIGTSHEVSQRSLHESPSPDTSSVDFAKKADSNEVRDGLDDSNHLSQPKRPMNAFMVWGQAIRRELHGKFSNVQNALLSKALGRVWRSLDAAEKETFVRKANQIKANHKRDYPNYRYRPRRLQERRTKCNMLIGIQLNHPVNQHPIQTNFALDHAVTYPSQAAPQALRDQLPRQITYDKHNLLDPTLDKDVSIEINNESELARQAGPVQAYEYQPYPPEFQNNQSVYHDFQQHGIAVNKQSVEFDHTIYKQYAYTMQHQHQQYQQQQLQQQQQHQQQHHQQQQHQQPTNYNVGSSGYPNSRGSLLDPAGSSTMCGYYQATGQSSLPERQVQGFFPGN